MARVAEIGRSGRRLGRFGGAWAWGLAGLLVVAAAVILDPVAERTDREQVPAFSIRAEDWRGNSARLPALR